MGKGGPQPAHQVGPGDLQLETASADLEDPEANIHGHLMPPVPHFMSSDKAIREDDDCSAADPADLTYDEVRDVDESGDRPSSCRQHNTNNNAKKTPRLRKRAQIHRTVRSAIDVFSSNLLDTKKADCHIKSDCTNMESFAADEVVLHEIKDRTQNNKYLRSSTEDDDNNKDNTTRSNRSNNREVNTVDTNAQPDEGYAGETSAGHFKTQTRNRWRDKSLDGAGKDNFDPEIRIDYQGSPKNVGQVKRGNSWRITKRNSLDNTGKEELSRVKCSQPTLSPLPPPGNRGAAPCDYKRSPSRPSTADTDRTSAANLSSPLATGMSWRSNGDPPGTHTLLEQEETLRSITPITMDLELPCLLQEAESQSQVFEMDKATRYHSPDCTQNTDSLKRDVKNTFNENNVKFNKNEILTLPDFGTKLKSLVKQSTFSEFSFVDKRKKNAVNESTRRFKESESSNLKLIDGMLSKEKSLERRLDLIYLRCTSPPVAAPTNDACPPKPKQGRLSPHTANTTKEMYRTKDEQDMDNIFDCALEYSSKTYCSVPVTVSNEVYKEIEFPVVKSYIDRKGTGDNKEGKVEEEDRSFIPRSLIETFKRATSFNALLHDNTKVTDEKENKLKLREEFKCAENQEKQQRVGKENRRKGIEKKHRKCLDNSSSRSKEKSAASLAPLSQNVDLRNLILASAIFSGDVAREGTEQDGEKFIIKDVIVGTGDATNPNNKATAFEEAFLKYKQSSFNNFVPGCGHEDSVEPDKSETCSENSNLSPKDKTVVNKSPLLSCSKKSQLSPKDKTVVNKSPFLSCSKNSQLSEKDETIVNKSPVLPSAKNSKLSLKDEAAVKKYPFLSCSKNSKPSTKDETILDKSPVLPSARNSKLSMKDVDVVNKSPVLPSTKNSKPSLKDEAVMNRYPFLSCSKNSLLSNKDEATLNKSRILPSVGTLSKKQIQIKDTKRHVSFENMKVSPTNRPGLKSTSSSPPDSLSTESTSIRTNRMQPDKLDPQRSPKIGKHFEQPTAITNDGLYTSNTDHRCKHYGRPVHKENALPTHPQLEELFPNKHENSKATPIVKGHEWENMTQRVANTQHPDGLSKTRDFHKLTIDHFKKSTSWLPNKGNLKQFTKTVTFAAPICTTDEHKPKQPQQNSLERNTFFNKEQNGPAKKTADFYGEFEQNQVVENVKSHLDSNRKTSPVGNQAGKTHELKITSQLPLLFQAKRNHSLLGQFVSAHESRVMTSSASRPAEKNYVLPGELIKGHERRAMTSRASSPAEKSYALPGELIKAHEKRVVTSRTPSPTGRQDSPPRQIISKHKSRSHSKNFFTPSPAPSKPEKDQCLSEQLTSNHENNVLQPSVQIQEEYAYSISEQSKSKDEDMSRMHNVSLHSQPDQRRYLSEHELLSQDERTTSTSLEFSSSTDMSPVPPINQNRNGKIKGSARNTPRKLNKNTDLTKDSYKAASYRVLSRYNILDTANTLAERANILMHGNARHHASPILYLPHTQVTPNTPLVPRVTPPLKPGSSPIRDVIRGFQSPINKPLDPENNLANVLKESHNAARSEHRSNKTKLGLVSNANTTNSNQCEASTGYPSEVQSARLTNHLRVPSTPNLSGISKLDHLNIELIKTRSENDVSTPKKFPLTVKPLSSEVTDQTNVSPIIINIHNVDSPPLHPSDFVNQKMGKQNSFISCLSARLFQSLSPIRLSANDEITRQRKNISSPVDDNTNQYKTVPEEEMSSPVDSPVIKKHPKDLIFDYSEDQTSEHPKADTQDNELLYPASECLSSSDQSAKYSVKSHESSDCSIYSKRTRDLLFKRYPFLTDLKSQKKLHPETISRSKSTMSSSSSKNSKVIAKPPNRAKCDTIKHTDVITCDRVVLKEPRRATALNNSSTVSGKQKLITEFNNSRRFGSSRTSSSSRSATDNTRASSMSEQEIICLIKAASTPFAAPVTDPKKQSIWTTKEQQNPNELSVMLDSSKGTDLQKQVEYFQSFKNWPNSGRTNRPGKCEKPFSFSPNFYSQAKNARMLPGLAMTKEQRVEVLRRLGVGATGVKKCVVEGKELGPTFKDAEKVTIDGQKENLIKVFTEGHYNPVNNIISVVVKPVNMVLNSAGLNVVVKVYRNLCEEKEETAEVSLLKKPKQTPPRVSPKDIIEVRATNPPFNTTTTKEADERHRRTFANMKII